MKRIVLLWPWFSTLADNYARILNDQGHQTFVFTTNKNWNFDRLTTKGLVFDQPTWRNLAGDSLTILRILCQFKPDLIICEESTDPRFILPNLFTECQFWKTRHDPEPHDHNHVLSISQKIRTNMNTMRATKVLAFSKSSFDIMRADKLWRLLPEIPLNEISELPPKNVHRRNFVTFGRIEPYKNIEWLVNFWNENCNFFQEEKLYIYGKGRVTYLGKNIIHVNERYNRNVLMNQLRNFRASIFPYKTASQSGVLQISQAAGLASIISPLGGLMEFQSSEKNVMTDINDEQSLYRLVSNFMNQEYANSQGGEAYKRLLKSIEDTKNDIRLSLM